MSTAFPPSRQNVYSKGETKNKKFHSLNINNLYQSGSSSNSISSSDNKKSNSTTGPSGTNNFSNVFTKTTGATGHQTSTSSSYGSGGGKISSSVRRGPVHLPSLKAEKSLALHHSNLLSSAASAVGSGLSSSNVLSSTDEVFSQHAVKQDSSNKLSSSGKDLGSGANKLLVNGHHNTDLSKKGADTADLHSPTSLAATSSTVTSSTPATWKNSAAVKAFDSIRNPASRFLFEKSFNSAPPLPSQTHRVNFLNKDSPQFVNEFPSLGIVKSNEKLGSKNVGKDSSNTHSPEKSNINSLKGGFIDRDKTKLDSDDTSKHNSKSKYSATLFGKNGNNHKSSTANDQNSGTSGKYGPGPALRPQTVGNWNASNQTKQQQQKESTSPLTNTSGDNNSSGVGLNNRTKIQNSLIQTMPDASYITSHPPPSVHTVSNNSTGGTSSNSKFQNGGSKFFNSVTSSSNMKRGPTSINDFPNTSSSYNTNFLTNNSITMNNNGYQGVQGESSSAYQFGSFPQQEQNRDLIGSVGYTGRRHQQMDSNTNVVRPIMMSSKTSSRGVPPSSSSSFDNDNFKFDVMSTGYRGGVNGQRHYQHADSSNNGPTSPQVQSKGLSVGPPHGGRRPSVSDDRRQRPQVGVGVNTWNGNRESEMKSTTGDDWTNMDDDFDFDKEIHSDEDEEVFSSERPSEMDPRQSVSGHQPSAHRGGSVVVNSSTTVFPRAIDGSIRHNTNGSYSRNIGAEYNPTTLSSVGSKMVPSSETPVEAVEYGDEKDVQEDEKDEERIEDYWFSRGGCEDGSDSHKSQVSRHLTPEECTSSRDASSKKINTNRRVDWTDSIDKVSSESTKKISSHQHSSSHMFVRDVRYPNDDRGVPSGAKHNIPSSPNKNNVVNRDQRNHEGSEPSEKRRGKGMLNADSSLELVSNEHSKVAGHDSHRRPSTVSHGVKGDYGQRVTTSGKMKDNNNKAKNDVKINESDNGTNEKASSTSTTTSTATKPFDWSTFKVNQKGDLTSNNNDTNHDDNLSKSSFVNKINSSNTHENTFSSSNGRKILQQQNVEKSGSSSPSSMISSSGGDFSSSLHHEPHQNTDESPFQRQQHVSKKSSHHSKVVPQSFRGNSNGHGEFEGTGGGKHRSNRRGGGEMGVSDDRDDGHHHARGGHSSGIGRGGRRGGPSNRNDKSSEVPPPMVSSSTRGRGSRGRGGGGVRNEKQYNNIMVNDASDKSHVTLTQRERRSKKDGLSSRPHTANKNGAHSNTDGGGDVPPPVSDEMVPPPSLVARKAPLKGLMDIEIEMPPEMLLAKKGGKGGGVNTLLSQFSANDHNDGESEKDAFSTSNKYPINDNFDAVKMENKHITDSMGRQSHPSDEVVVGQKGFDSSQQNNRAMNNNSEATVHEVNENFCNKLENTLVFENSMFSSSSNALSSSKGSTVVFDNGMKSTNEEKSDAMCGVPSSMPNSVYSGTTNTNSLPLTSINDPNSAPFNDSKFSNWGPPTARPESGGGPGTADDAAGSKSSNGRDIRQSPAPSAVNNATTTRRTNRHIMSGDGMDEELASADDDLNFKIASVKKMWDISASGSLPPAAFENEHQTSRVRHHIPPPPTQLHTADGDLSSVSGKCSSSQVDQRLIVERPSSVMDAPSSSQSTCVVSVSGPVPPMKMFSPFAPPSSSSSTSRVASALVGGVSSSITGGENVAKVRPQPHFHATTDSATTHIGGSSAHASHMLNENGAYPMHHHHHHPSHHFNGGGSSSFMNKSSAAANTPFGPTTMFHSPAVGNPFGQAFHPHHHTGGYPGSSPFHHPHQQSSSALYEAFHYLNEARASGGGSVAASAHHSSHNAAANLYSQPPPSASMRLPPIGSKLAPVSSSSSSFLGAEKLIHSQQVGGGGGGPIGGQYGMSGGGGPSMGDPVSNGNGSSEFDAAFVAVAAALHHQQQQQQSKAAAAAALAAAAHLLPPPTSTNISSSSVVVAASNDPTPLVANSQSVPSNHIRNQESSKDSSGMIESRGSSNPQSTANSTAPSSGVVEESQSSNKGRDSQQRVNSNGGNNND